MERFRPRDMATLHQCLLAIYAPCALETFPGRILGAIRAVIPAEHYSYNALDFPACRSVLAVVEPASLDFPASRELLSTYLPEHPVANHYHRTGDSQALMVADFLTQRQFHCLTLYNEFYRRIGTEYQIAVRLPLPTPRLTAVVLNRLQRNFSERDRLCLNILQPHLTQAYQNAQALAQYQHESAFLSQESGGVSRGMLVLQGDGSPCAITRRVWEWMTEYFDASPWKANRLPEELQRWVTHQQSVWGRHENVSPPHQPLCRERGGKRLIIHLLAEPSGSHYLLLEEQRLAYTAASLESLGLTRRESEVLLWVTHGKTDQDIATILTVSTRTVQKHLEHIYAKLGVENRTAAARRALESLRSDGESQ